MIKKVQYWRDELFPRYDVELFIKDGIVYAVKDGVCAQVGGYNNLVTSPNRANEMWLEDTLREKGWLAQQQQ